MTWVPVSCGAACCAGWTRGWLTRPRVWGRGLPLLPLLLSCCSIGPMEASLVEQVVELMSSWCRERLSNYRAAGVSAVTPSAEHAAAAATVDQHLTGC